MLGKHPGELRVNNADILDAGQYQTPGFCYAVFCPLINSPPMRSSIDGPGHHFVNLLAVSPVVASFIAKEPTFSLAMGRRQGMAWYVYQLYCTYRQRRPLGRRFYFKHQ
jgi:hypothetical protein